MRKPFLFIAITLIATLSLGCGIFTSLFPDSGALPTPIPTSLAQNLPELSGDWLIHFTQSGGIAGLSRSLEISSTGETIITDMRSGVKQVGRLSDKDRAAVGDLVRAANFRPAAGPSACADCFIFNLQITSASGVFQGQVDQVELPDSGLQPVVDFLAALLNNSGG